MYDSKFDTRNNQINYRDKINSKLSKNISLYRTSNKFEKPCYYGFCDINFEDVVYSILYKKQGCF